MLEIPVHGRASDGTPFTVYAAVDDSDYHKLADRNWHYKDGYATRWTKGGPGKPWIEYMHRTIMGVERGTRVDHANRNRLDNQRSNLRTATSQQNAQNALPQKRKLIPYKGVRQRPDRLGFNATICSNRQLLNLGTYESSEDAAIAYDVAAGKLFASYAYFNFPGREVPAQIRDKVERRLSKKGLNASLAAYAREKRAGCLSKYKGVTRINNRWIAQIRIKGKLRIIGRFRFEEEASNAYQAALQEHLARCLVCECIIPAEGDARPIPDLSKAAPSELQQTWPLPEV